MTATEARIARLSEDKQRLLRRLLDDPAPVAVTPLRPRPRRWLVTAGQRRTYLMQRTEPEQTFWNMCLGLRVRGPFSPGCFARAIRRLVRRHEVLAARFGHRDGAVLQLLDGRAARMVSIDCLRPGQQAGEPIELAWRAEHERPFDLDREPPLRGRVLRIAEDDHALFLTVHHIVMDGWAANILLRDLDELMSAGQAGRSASLRPAELRFCDYAAWQQGWLRSWPRLEQSRFWRAELPGNAPDLDLPSALPRPAQPRFDRGHLPIILTDEISAGVRRLAAAESTTPYVVLLAAYAALLSRLTGADDLVIASPVACRQQDERLEHVVGLFANLVPIRCDLRGAATMREVVRRIRAVAGRALANQDLPIEELLAELRLASARSRSPLSQHIFALYNYPRHTSLLAGLEVAEFDAEPSHALQIYAPLPVRPDTCLRIQDRAGTRGLGGLAEYNRAVIDDDSARKFLAQYADAVRTLVAEPDAAR